jgi:hypothetical protein
MHPDIQVVIEPSERLTRDIFGSSWKVVGKNGNFMIAGA